MVYYAWSPVFKPIKGMNRQHKIVIPANRFIDWTGGRDYLQAMIEAMLSNSLLEVHIIYPLLSPVALIKTWLSNMISALPERWKIKARSLPLGHHRNLKCIYLPDSALIHHCYCRLIRTSAVGPSIFKYPWWFNIPVIGYIADYQHRELPYLFSDKEIDYRNRLFQSLLDACDVTVLSSEYAINNAIEYSVTQRKKLRRIPIMSQFKRELVQGDPPLTNYNITKPYFICCNQLCLHKNHTTLIKALSAVVNEGYEIEVVLTGNMSDYRDPSYLQTLIDLSVSLGVAERLKILGLIPKRDQIQLMVNAIAAIQPSLFEGGPGGGFAYEAEAYGVRMLMSDTAINTETTYQSVSFFQATNHIDLAASMISCFVAPYTRPSEELLVSRSLARQREGGAFFYDILDQLSSRPARKSSKL